jgi:hypothetical protein
MSPKAIQIRKPGRPPKPPSETYETSNFILLWEHELDTFKSAAGRESVARFLRDAVVEFIESKKALEDPGPVVDREGVKYKLLLTHEQKVLITRAALGFNLPVSRLVRAAGLMKAKAIENQA